jgi:hypothetical protein
LLAPPVPRCRTETGRSASQNDPSALTASELTTLLLGAGAVIAGVVAIALIARRPLLGCALLAAGVPLTTALGRDTVIPLLRVNEAILIVVLAGIGLNYLLTKRSVTFTGLDLAVAGFAVGTSFIPWLVLSFARSDIDFDTWRAVLSPLQFLAIYICFAQLRASDRDLRWLLNLTLFTSVIVGIVAIVELVDVPSGTRGFINAYFPPENLLLDDPTASDYRPTSTLGSYGAVGAFAMLNILLAQAMARKNDSRSYGAWLTVVMALNIASLVASLTWAPAVALVLGIVIVAWYTDHVPTQMWIGAVAILGAAAILWPFVSARIDTSTALGSLVNVDARLRNWQLFFLPVLAEHLWLGTGTVLPSSLPPNLSDFVDNEFLRMGFRAGLAGIGLLILMLSTAAIVALRCRASSDPLLISLGAAALATVVTIFLVGITAEYLAFGGLSQYVAMLFGLLAARMRFAAQSPALAQLQVGSPSPVRANAGLRSI